MYRFCFSIVILCGALDAFPTTNSTDESIPSTKSNATVLTNLGELNNPALSCQQIKSERPDARNGNYWINSARSTQEDSFLAHCDLDHGKTCIHPEISCSDLVDIDPKFKQIWYNITPDQLKALRNISQTATQNVTYHSLHSTTTRAATSKIFDHDYLKLIGNDEFELNPRTEANITSNSFIPHPHPCSLTSEISETNRLNHHQQQSNNVKKSSGVLLYTNSTKNNRRRTRRNPWMKTKMSLKTEKPTRLPISAIEIRDGTNPVQIVFVQLGPVCFY